jgi:hypothetical protein
VESTGSAVVFAGDGVDVEDLPDGVGERVRFLGRQQADERRARRRQRGIIG